MLPELKLIGKNGRNVLGEYPNPRRGRGKKEGETKKTEDRRKYKEEKREQERRGQKRNDRN